jgi:hypothetical protein
MLLECGFVSVGCLEHNKPDTVHPVSGLKMRDLYEETEARIEQLEGMGLAVVARWEHEFDERCEQDPDYYELAERFTLQERLRPRDAFFGGKKPVR